METIDLKLIWQRHHQNTDDIPKYTIEEIRSYRNRRPHKMVKSIRAVLWFDIIYKAALVTGWLGIMFLIKQAWISILALTSTAILLMLLGVELRFLKQWNAIDLSTSIRNSLSRQYSFMTKFYGRFLVTSAISNSFFVALGFVWYDFEKYKEVFNIDRLAEPVSISFVIMAFVISAGAQWPAYRNQTDNLEINLKAIDDDELQGIQMKQESKRRLLNLVIFGFLILLGIVTLLGVIYYFT